jgi:hypothetical protein
MTKPLCALDEQAEHGLVNFLDTKAKFPHLKKLPVKGSCLSEFTDWRYSQSC